MASQIYWAHSASRDQPDDSRKGWQRLSRHVEAVSKLAATLARAASPADERFARDAALTGLLHDYGKYTDCFQKVLT